MAQISTYPELASVVPTAALALYDPTDPAKPDKLISLATLAKAASVVDSSAADATIIVDAEAGDARDVSVQLNDADGNPLVRAALVHLIVFTTAAATALSNGGSTGLAIDADGLIVATITAKKVFLVKSDDTGLITLTWTDTGTDAAFLGVVLPDGRIVMSAALTNA
jgi:hypothetical protein